MISDHFRHLFQDHESLRRKVEELSEEGRSLPRNILKDRCTKLCSDFDSHLENTKVYIYTLPGGDEVEELKRSFTEDRTEIADEIERIRLLEHQAKTFYDEALRRVKIVDSKISFARSRLTEHRGKVLRQQLEHLEAEVRKGLGTTDL